MFNLLITFQFLDRRSVINIVTVCYIVCKDSHTFSFEFNNNKYFFVIKIGLHLFSMNTRNKINDHKKIKYPTVCK